MATRGKSEQVTIAPATAPQPVDPEVVASLPYRQPADNRDRLMNLVDAVRLR